jgi:hypothetical protein
MRKLDIQIHRNNKNILKYLQRMPSETAAKQLLYYERIEDTIQEGQEQEAVMFEDGMG